MNHDSENSGQRERERKSNNDYRESVFSRSFQTIFGIRSQDAPYSYYQNTSRIISIIGWTIAIGFFAYSILGFNVKEINIDDPKSIGQLFDNNLQSFKIAVVALLLGFAVERVSMNIADMGWEARQDELHASLVRTVTSMSAIQYVGPSDDVHHDLARSIRRATRVKNTFLNVGGAPRWDSKSEQSILELYEEFLNKNPHNLWQDIVSVNELHKFRHTRLFRNQAEPIGEHQIAVLRSSMPIINFIIIENPLTQIKEVYFGWIFDKAKSLTNIYKSTDPKLMDLFDLYFDIIWNEKSAETWAVKYTNPPNRRGPLRKFTVDKAGVWVTALVNTDGTTRNNAVIKIDFGQNGPLIEGLIVDDDHIRSIRHTDIVNTSGQIFFEYQELSNDGIQLGFCLYKFSKESDEDVIKGYLIEPPRLSRTFIFGVRYNDWDLDIADKGAALLAIEKSKDILGKLITADLRSHHKVTEADQPGRESSTESDIEGT